MKKYITIAALGLISILGTKALAEQGPHGAKEKCHSGKVFVEAVNLTKEQELIAKELRELKKETRVNMRINQGQKIETMVSFVDGELSREALHQKITEHHNQMREESIEIQRLLFNLIESYSEEQKEQVASNFQESKECREDLKEKHVQTIQKRKEDRKGKRAPEKILFKELDLSENQQKLLENIVEGKEDFRKEMKPLHHEIIEDVLSGQISILDAEEQFQQKVSERNVSAHSQADAMMDLLETFSAEQKEQFLENAEELKGKIKHRKEKRTQRDQYRGFGKE